jgi:hypothetical protein
MNIVQVIWFAYLFLCHRLHLLEHCALLLFAYNSMTIIAIAVFIDFQANVKLQRRRKEKYK